MPTVDLIDLRARCSALGLTPLEEIGQSASGRAVLVLGLLSSLEIRPGCPSMLTVIDERCSRLEVVARHGRLPALAYDEPVLVRGRVVTEEDRGFGAAYVDAEDVRHLRDFPEGLKRKRSAPRAAGTGPREKIK